MKQLRNDGMMFVFNVYMQKRTISIVEYESIRSDNI